MITPQELARPQNALPFWLSLLLIPLVWIGALNGGWLVLLMPLTIEFGFSALDAVLGRNLRNADPETDDDTIKWYTVITTAWVPLQFLTLFGLIWYVTGPGDAHLGALETIVLFFGVGMMTGTVGINYSHELMHQKSRAERWLGDILLAMVLYSHFRSEHLLVHHSYVGTPRDTVTARYNEGFYRFYPRILIGSLKSSFRAEKEKLAKKQLPWTNGANPFWRYWGLQMIMLALALMLGGWIGLLLFIFQASVAVFHLEIVNYVEHYGLTRKHLGEGKYEHVMPHHSWNAAHKASNWLLINLQRHSDHHYKPNRRFPLLQNYGEAQAPQLPFGYPIMTMAASFPPLWRRVMNPRVKKWRAMYYPEITDWKPYNKAQNPMPR